MKRLALVLAMVCSTPTVAQVTEQDVVLGDPQMLGSLYFVVSLHEYCRVQIPVAAIDAIGADARRLEERMGLSFEESERSYQAALETTSELAPECDPESLASALGSYAEGISPFGGL